MALLKEASSLIIVAKSTALKQNVDKVLTKLPDTLNANNTHRTFDYKVPLLKRSSASKSFANACVFPGGVVDGADLSPKWHRVFQNDSNRFVQFLKDLDSRAKTKILNLQTYKSFGPADQLLRPDVGLRITAIRETFEETGVLLVKTKEGGTVPKGNLLTEWRFKIKKDANEFVGFCEHFGCYPDLWSLCEWSNWVTPTLPNFKKRFDTLFFISFLEELPDIQSDDGEITDFMWSGPSEALDSYYKEKLWLAPPQVYEMTRLKNFGQWEDLKEFGQDRCKKGLQRIQPVHLNLKDAVTAVLPGDDFYPNDPESVDGVLKMNLTLQELRIKTKNFHRIEMLEGEGNFFYMNCNFLCNIKLPYGHIAPIPY